MHGVLVSVSPGANSVSKSLFPIICFFLLWFFSVFTSLKASFICSHRAAGAVQLCCKVLGVTGRQWPLHQKVSISHYFGGLFQVFFFPVTTQSLNYSFVFSPDCKHQVKAKAAQGRRLQKLLMAAAPTCLLQMLPDRRNKMRYLNMLTCSKTLKHSESNLIRLSLKKPTTLNQTPSLPLISLKAYPMP